MKINNEVVTTPPRDAATVVMLRDTPQGLEVFLVKRHELSDVMGGAYVFPGGKLDASDSQLDAHIHLDQTPDYLQVALGEPSTPTPTATGLYVAALREAFEESGVLFAKHAHTESIADTQRAAQMLKDAVPFNQMLAQLSLRLQTRSVLPWSRWITPVMPSVSSKRFDTRFFVSAIPPDQFASHDNVETTQSVWLAPRTALEQYRDGQIQLAPPQIMSLAHLSRHATVQSVMTEARSTPPPVVLPEAFDDGGERVICYPGDPSHSIPSRALPGPTRLRFRNRRFEPVDGFDALFS
jgi:8-oxo-dGTP pyrophosphatase MutT (NUDIX family)